MEFSYEKYNKDMYAIAQLTQSELKLRLIDESDKCLRFQISKLLKIIIDDDNNTY